MTVILTVNQRLVNIVESLKMASYAFMLNSTGQNDTAPRRIADFEESEIAITFTKGKRHTSTNSIITQVSTTCPAPRLRTIEGV